MDGVPFLSEMVFMIRQGARSFIDSLDIILFQVLMEL